MKIPPNQSFSLTAAAGHGAGLCRSYLRASFVISHPPRNLPLLNNFLVCHFRTGKEQYFNYGRDSTIARAI